MDPSPRERRRIRGGSHARCLGARCGARGERFARRVELRPGGLRSCGVAHDLRRVRAARARVDRKRPRRAFQDCPRSEKPEADTFCTPEGCKKYLPRALGTTRGFRKYLGDVSGTLRGSESTSEMSLEPLGVPEVPTSGSRNPSGCSESTSLGLLAARDLLSVSLARFWSLRELHRRSASAS